MNHAISALKFKIIREFLELGWNVLLSDVDVILVQVQTLRPETLLPLHMQLHAQPRLAYYRQRPLKAPQRQCAARPVAKADLQQEQVRTGQTYTRDASAVCILVLDTLHALGVQEMERHAGMCSVRRIRSSTSTGTTTWRACLMGAQPCMQGIRTGHVQDDLPCICSTAVWSSMLLQGYASLLTAWACDGSDQV